MNYYFYRRSLSQISDHSFLATQRFIKSLIAVLFFFQVIRGSYQPCVVYHVYSEISSAITPRLPHFLVFALAKKALYLILELNPLLGNFA